MHSLSLSLLPTSTVKEDALGLPTLPTLIFKSKRLRMTYFGSLGHLDLKLHRSHILIISETPYALLEKFLVMWLSSARKIIIPEHHQLPRVSHSMIAVVQSLSHVRLSATSWTAARQVSLSFTISQSVLKFMSIESVVLSNHLILCHPPLLWSSIFPSIRVFSSESALCITWPKHHHQSFQWIFRVDFLKDWLIWPLCSARDSQESSPAPQFKSINSLLLGLLYSPTLTSVHDHWKNHSFYKSDFVWKLTSLLC